MAEVYPDTAAVIARLVGVRFAVLNTGRDIAATADVLLAAHHVSGNARIEVTQADVNAYVSLVDEAAASIEFGHFTDDGEIDATVTYVPGLYIITRAAKL